MIKKFLEEKYKLVLLKTNFEQYIYFYNLFKYYKYIYATYDYKNFNFFNKNSL